jgi:hypothetical protein
MPTPTIITVAEADVILGITEPWFSEADTAVKEDALGWAEVYFAANYTCVYDVDDTPDNILEGLAIIGNQFLIDPTAMFPVDSDVNVTSKKVKAGSVESAKSFASPSQKRFIDQYPEITALFSSYCDLTPSSGSGAKSVPIVRN